MKWWAAIWLVLSHCCWAELDTALTTSDHDSGYVKPFKITNSIYYVGDRWVSSYLIDTQQGLVLIDSLDMPYSYWVEKNIQALGFDAAHIKYVLVTHGHSDHVAGAHLFESRGAKVILSEAAMTLTLQQAEKLKSTKNSFEPPKQPQWMIDGDSLNLGNTVFEWRASPGHTLGSMSIIITQLQSEPPIRALIYGGMGDNFEGIAQARLYLASVERMQQQHAQRPFNLNLANHPHMAALFEKYAEGQPFISTESVTSLLQRLHDRAEAKLASELRKQGS